MRPDLNQVHLNLRIAMAMIQREDGSQLMLFSLVETLADYIRMREAEESQRASND